MAPLETIFDRLSPGTDRAPVRVQDSRARAPSRGGFGGPTSFVNGGETSFGEDRAPPVEAALARGAMVCELGGCEQGKS